MLGTEFIYNADICFVNLNLGGTSKIPKESSSGLDIAPKKSHFHELVMFIKKDYLVTFL